MTRLGAVEKRTPARSRVYLPATIQSSCGCQDALVRDISRLGALLEVSVTPPIGSVVQLTCARTTVEGRIAWVDSTWFGMEFGTPLSNGPLMEQVGRRLKVSAPRTYRRETE